MKCGVKIMKDKRLWFDNVEKKFIIDPKDNKLDGRYVEYKPRKDFHGDDRTVRYIGHDKFGIKSINWVILKGINPQYETEYTLSKFNRDGFHAEHIVGVDVSEERFNECLKEAVESNG